MAYNNVRIQQRLDSIENWTSSNPMLLSGEVAYVRFQDGSIRVKVGDGTSRFAQLKYLGEDEIITKHLSAIHISQGFNAYSSPTGLAGGAYVSAEAIFSQALGYNSTTKSGDDFSFVWNGDSTEVPGQLGGEDYSSHGKGTFNVNPLSGLSGFYIGDEPLADALGQKVWIKDPANEQYADGKYSDLSVVKIPEDEYIEKVASQTLVDNGVLYVVSADHVNAYGQKIVNVAAPTELSDAATKGYVDAQISSIPAPDLSEYYKKAETSSATELANALDGKADADEVAELSDALSAAISTDIKNLADNYAKKTEINVSYVSEDKKIYLSAGDHVTSIDTDDFIKDGMISSVSYDETTHILHIVWNTDAGGKTTDISLSGLIDTYSAGYGLSLDSSAFSIDTSIVAQLSDVEHKVWIKDIANPEYEDGKYSDISVIKIEKDEFDEKAAAEVPQLCSSTLYVVDSPYIDAYGQQLCNLTMSDDPNEAYLGVAATKQYVDAEINSIDVSKQLSGYVKLSSDSEQSISSDIQVDGWLRVGNLSVSEEGSSGKAEWGYITGDIEQQQDLLSVNYPLDKPILKSEVVDGTTYKRFDIKDHTIATITLANSDPVRVHFPSKPTANFCRDFIIKIKVTSQTMPQVYFVKADNDTDIGFEYADEDWTTLEAGINYFTFTETERS